MHCDNPACVKATSDGAVYKRKDGIVLIDPVKAKGNKDIVKSCPYRQIEWNEELQLPQKCTLCAHMLDNGEPEPRCVETCPAAAIVFGDLDDPDSEIAKLVASGATEIMHPEYGLREKVTYVGLPRKFVAGTVVYGDVDEVAKGIEVVLSGDGVEQTATTNGFGDFVFDGLPDNINVTVDVKADGYDAQSVKTRTSKDVYVGEVVLSKVGVEVAETSAEEVTVGR
jgi:ferredoxin